MILHTLEVQVGWAILIMKLRKVSCAWMKLMMDKGKRSPFEAYCVVHS